MLEIRILTREFARRVPESIDDFRLPRPATRHDAPTSKPLPRTQARPAAARTT